MKVRERLEPFADGATHWMRTSSANDSTVIRVAELFAGVGGFRLGLERADSATFRTIFSSQWEPGVKRQYASEIYCRRFGSEGHSNANITTYPTDAIPDHDLLVGGFPCQDYSVAKTLSQSAGIVGQKGVLWWDIHRILSEKGPHKAKYLFLENVDRLLKSPAKQRGRDFAIMLASLSDLGYAVEWRVINAADYGMPQRRRRVFFFAYHTSTDLYKRLSSTESKHEWIVSQGVLADSLPCVLKSSRALFPEHLDGDLAFLTNEFNRDNYNAQPFANAGVMIEREYFSADVMPCYRGPVTVLRDIIEPDELVPDEFFIDEVQLPQWEYLKGTKTIERVSKANGHSYMYSEGSMAFPDSLDKPGRTIITGEGGSTPSRFKHVIQTDSGRFRRLTPIELERMNMFPDNHTAGIPDIKRAFLMGNALVVGIVTRVGLSLLKEVSKSYAQ